MFTFTEFDVGIPIILAQLERTSFYPQLVGVGY